MREIEPRTAARGRSQMTNSDCRSHMNDSRRKSMPTAGNSIEDARSTEYCRPRAWARVARFLGSCKPRCKELCEGAGQHLPHKRHSRTRQASAEQAVCPEGSWHRAACGTSRFDASDSTDSFDRSKTLKRRSMGRHAESAQHRTGLWLSAVLGHIVGSVVTLLVTAPLAARAIDGPGHWVCGLRTDATGLPILGRSTTGED